MSLTALVLGTVMLGFGHRRYTLWPATRLHGKGFLPRDAWPLESGMLTPSGKEIYRQDCWDAGHYFPEDLSRCMRGKGGVTDFTDYHPAPRVLRRRHA
ncbi:hypothetical protein [Streptomyces sp. NPDC001743]|uniref:hypothetical protein n=1 Tax=Streptomyces sp. NPDC001743 TaxID=3154397 RepID=UPI00333383E9